MAINDSSKVDFLWKKIQFGVSNTSVSGKEGYEEIYGSEVPTYATNIWTQAGDIESPAPDATIGVHEYFGTATAIECTPDPTVPNNRTWLATTTYGEVGTRTGDWIAPTFDPGYLVQVYRGDPAIDGVPLNQGITNQEWVYDYVTGALSFVNNVPAGVGDGSSASRIFIVGHRYVGSKGLTGAGGATASLEVADIAERDALEPTIGMIAYVNDASGDTANSAHIGAGQAATYMYISSGWKLIATEDSSRADMGTVTIMLDSSTVSGAIYTMPSNTRLASAIIEVKNAFDGAPVINVGDATVNDRIIGDNFVDLEEVQSYKVNSNHLYETETDVLLEFNAGGSTVGDAVLILKWSS